MITGWWGLRRGSGVGCDGDHKAAARTGGFRHAPLAVREIGGRMLG